MNILLFYDTISNMDVKPKTLYHGSQHEITDGVIHTKLAYLTATNQPIKAVFATDDFVHAKIYAAMRKIGVQGLWKCPSDGNTLYVQKINPNISAIVYVYELDSDGFEHDNSDYYCMTDKKIKKIHKFDVMQEIRNGNIEVFVLKDEFNKPNMSRSEWKEITKDKTKFELYKPDSKKLDMQILAKAKNLVLDK